MGEGDRNRDYWAQACNTSLSRTLDELTQRNYACNGIAVSLFALLGARLASSCVTALHTQISIFASAAVFSAVCYLLEYRLLRWRRTGKEVKGDRIWKNLRRFSGWMCAGCIAGTIAFSAWMQWRTDAYRWASISSEASKRRVYYELQSSSNRYYVAFHIFYPVAQLCVIFALNMLLRRVSDHASHSYYNVARDQDAGRSTHNGKFDWRDCVGEYALYKLVRAMHIIAMLLCALHVAARVVAAGFSADVAARFYQAAAATDLEGRETKSSLQIFSQILSDETRTNTPITVARLLEAAVFVMCALAFLLFFPTCIIMFIRVEQRLNNILAEMNLRSGFFFLRFACSSCLLHWSHSLHTPCSLRQVHSGPPTLTVTSVAAAKVSKALLPFGICGRPRSPLLLLRWACRCRFLLRSGS